MSDINQRKRDAIEAFEAEKHDLLQIVLEHPARQNIELIVARAVGWGFDQGHAAHIATQMENWT